MRTNAPLWRITLPLAIGIAACGGEASTTGEAPAVTDDAYVSVMVDLLLLDAKPADAETEEERQAIMDTGRAEILTSHGVTPQELIDFAAVAGRDPGRMERMWHRVTQAVDSLRSEELRLNTEARSELEGKLGEAARQAADSAEGTGRAGQSPDAALTPRPGDPRLRLDSLRRSRVLRAESEPDG